MSSSKYRNMLFVVVMAVVPALLSGKSTKYRQKHPLESDAKNIILGFDGIDVVMSNNPDPKYFCERFRKTSTSKDGRLATYNVVLKNAGCEGSMRTGNATFIVVNDTILHETTTIVAGVSEVTVLYLVKNVCFVSWASRSSALFLCENSQKSMKRDHSCYEKFVEYSGGNITHLRDQYICKNVPPNP